MLGHKAPVCQKTSDPGSKITKLKRNVLEDRILLSLFTAADEERKWRHVVNGVGFSRPAQFASGLQGASSLWTPSTAGSGSPTPIASPTTGGDGDGPLNLSVARTPRRVLSPCPDAKPAIGTDPLRRLNKEAEGCSPPPAHHPQIIKSDNQSAKKSALLSNEVLYTPCSICPNPFRFARTNVQGGCPLPQSHDATSPYPWSSPSTPAALPFFNGSPGCQPGNL